MTGSIIKISDLHLLTMTGEHCGTGFRFDLSRDVTIPDKCPICVVNWEKADQVRTLANSLTELRELDGGPLSVSFRILA